MSSLAARAFQGRRAGVASRLAAAIVDGVVVLAMLLVGYGTAMAAGFLVDPVSFRLPRPSRALSLGVALVVTVGYLTTGWATGGRTYGALVMGLRLVAPDRLRWIRAFLRALACVLFPLGLLWSAVSTRNRSVQDIVLRTSVVYDWPR